MKSIVGVCIVCFATSLVGAAEPLKSGPQVGDKVPGQFEPFNVTGANAGEEWCLFCQFGNNPTVMIFAREPSAALTTLLKNIDEVSLKHKKADFCSCAIFCPKGMAQRPALKELAAKQDFKEIILATMDEAPKPYQISKDADVTVLLYTGVAVQANHAFRKGELSDQGIAAILKDVGKILPNP